MLRYSFEEIRGTFHYHGVNEEGSGARLKNRVELRKLWEKEVEDRINYLSIEWQIIDWVTACEGWGLRYEYKSWLEYTKINTRCDTKLCTKIRS